MFGGHTLFNASLVLLIVRARFVSMGSSLEEASRDLGATALATFRQVTLPRLAPAIVAGAMLSFTFSFDDVVISNFTAGAGNDTWPLRILAGLRFGLSPDLNAAATMMLAVTLVGLGAVRSSCAGRPARRAARGSPSRARPSVAERRTGLVYDERCLAHSTRRAVSRSGPCRRGRRSRRSSAPSGSRSRAACSRPAACCARDRAAGDARHAGRAGARAHRGARRAGARGRRAARAGGAGPGRLDRAGHARRDAARRGRAARRRPRPC